MIVIGANHRGARVVYAEEIDGQFYLSPFAEAKAGGRYRPIARFDTKEQLEQHVQGRCEVQWLTS